MIKLASPDLRDSDIQRALGVLQSGNLVQGENVKAFEKALCSFASLEHSAVVSSGTAALHLALIASGIQSGDSIIVPAFTFPATANVVERIGARVILCDVDPDSFVISVGKLKRILEADRDPGLKAVMVVHEFGYPASMVEISHAAKEKGLVLIEDAACALGTVVDGYHVGHYSDMACFSFHPRKAITTGEGGAVMSHSRDLVERIRIFRNHGICLDNGHMDFVESGLNYRMTDFQAALAIGQLERFGEELEKRRILVNRYCSLLRDAPRLSLPQNHEGHSWQSFMVILDESIDRDGMIRKLAERGIQANLGAQALNCLTYYKRKYAVDEKTFPNATRLYRHGLVLPLYGKLNTRDIDFIAESVIKLLRD